jgi:hypothetical protein
MYLETGFFLLFAIAASIAIVKVDDMLRDRKLFSKSRAQAADLLSRACAQRTSTIS